MGGLVIVQSEESAGYNGMPNSAIATQLANFVLSPDQMPNELIRYRKSAPQTSFIPRVEIETPSNVLQKSEHEIGILFKELLIGATSFFRDPQAFIELKGFFHVQIFATDID